MSKTTEATTAIMLNDEDLIVSSRAIVKGKVLAVESRFDPDQSNIYTYITVQVQKVLKGEIHTTQIVVRQLAGQQMERCNSSMERRSLQWEREYFCI